MSANSYNLVKKLSFILFVCSIFLYKFSVVFSQFSSADPAQQQNPVFAPGITAEHLFLAKLAGSWKLNVAVYKKGSEPTFYIGKSDNKLILDDHFIKIDRDITSDEALFSSMQVIGYNDIKKKFVMLSMDDTSNQFKYFEGVQSADKKQLIFNNVNVFSTDKNQMKIVFTFDRDNKYLYEVFNIETNKEIKTMEIQCIKP
jgi:hypothetical protein